MNRIKTSLFVIYLVCFSFIYPLTLKENLKSTELISPPSLETVKDKTLEAAGVASACLNAIMSNLNPDFCWKSGGDVGIIPTGCPKGYFRSLALCYNNCAPGYSHVAGVCWAHCGGGYADHGLTCFRHLFDFYFKHSYIPHSITNFDAPCPKGMYRSGALCYRDCANIGMVNCGIGACAADDGLCGSSIASMVLDSLTSIADAISTVLSFGASKAVFTTVKTAIKKVGMKALKSGASRVAKTLKNRTLRKVLYNKAKNWLKTNAKSYLKDVGTNLAINGLCEGVWNSWSNSSLKGPDINEDDVKSAVDIFNVEGSMKACNEDNALDCAKNILTSFSAFDPSGLLSLATTFMHPSCDVGTKDFREEEKRTIEYKENLPLDYDTKKDEDCIILYEKCDFKGRTKRVCYTYNFLFEFNDLTSSFSAGVKTSGIFFEDMSLQGSFMPFNGGQGIKCMTDPNLPIKLNNKISSVLLRTDCFIINFYNERSKTSKLINFVNCDDEPYANFEFRDYHKNVASYSFTEKPIEAILYEDYNYQGKSFSLIGGKPIDFAKLPFKAIKSVKLIKK